MIRYLSLDWIDAMHHEVTHSESIQQLAEVHDIGVTQVVHDGPEGTVIYHLQVGEGSVAFGPGPAPQEHVRLEQSWDTAVGVATDTLPAQDAFIKGLVTISGDPQSIVDAMPVFAALDAAFEKVRPRTTYA